VHGTVPREAGDSAASAGHVDALPMLALALAAGTGRDIAAQLQATPEGRWDWEALHAFVMADQRLRAIAGHRLPVLRARARELLRQGARTGMWLLPFSSSSYPPLLRQLHDPPLVLWGAGGADVLGRPAVAIVGARAASNGALQMAHRLGRDLAAAGLVVVSGLARGVDGAAHGGALETGRTVAVLGGSLDELYPPEHRGLADRIASGGAVVSEFPPGTPPLRHHFPRRNRIVAGLALGVVVVEAAEKSGALITAREALDQGKEVMVVPGLALAGRNRGGHALIKDGAALVESATDVLEVLAQAQGCLPAGEDADVGQAGRAPTPPRTPRDPTRSAGDGQTDDLPTELDRWLAGEE
jgi:DNA processing protein